MFRINFVPGKSFMMSALINFDNKLHKVWNNDKLYMNITLLKQCNDSDIDQCIYLQTMFLDIEFEEL